LSICSANDNHFYTIAEVIRLYFCHETDLKLEIDGEDFHSQVDLFKDGFRLG